MRLTRSLLGVLPLMALAPMPMRTVALVPIAPHALDGYALTQKITATGAQSLALTLRIKAAQGRVRFDMESAEFAQLGGLYMLVGDSGKVTSVMSQMSMAMKMDASMISSSGVSGMGPAPSIKDVSFTVEDLGAGETMFGSATHKYRYHSRYATTSATRGALKGEATIDAWIAPGLPGLADGLQKFADTFGAAFGGMAGGGSASLTAEIKAKLPKGYTMKAAVKSVETDAAGVAETTTTTLEVTEYAKASFEESTFEVPANFQVMDMNSMFRGRGGNRF